MNRKQVIQDSTPKFNAKPYVREGLTESEIIEIKSYFDIFDREHIGSISPKCTSHLIKS